ncbi:MAG: ABC transporter ATP-binding protein/permease [Clostridiales bacterium]|nr:ABC transporter ATP-binding protein/permease [Clostridiales bacterium]
MLELKNIVKEYVTEDERVQALKGVSLKFRKCEFVSILGPSGCGKTTLLNIVGGLDRYDSGDLVINGKSTKDYTDKDWDTYRNHSVGFVFQSYNLIPHQTVLQNVELALTLSGVGAEERKQRAIAVLEKVGLKSKLNSKPNQLSGGQMQRVAIARALINDPEILLADEPTGALDSKTSVQIMDLLKEISNDRLIVMVTHNPEIAETYSSRIIRMLDGEIVEDPNPVTDQEFEEEKSILSNDQRTNKGKGKTSMSFKTALSLSLKNLLTKKTRTLLVSFAGSIGIIGIALILSLSSGFQAYINRVQEDTLSNYPIQITATTPDYSAILDNLSGGSSKLEKYPTDGKINANQTFTKLMEAYNSSQVSNNLGELKEFLDKGNYDKEKISAIQYTYNIDFEVHGTDVYGEEKQLLMGAFDKLMSLNLSGSGGGGEDKVGAFASSFMNMGAWSEAIDNEVLIKSQYDLVDESISKWADFSNPDEVMLVVDAYNRIPDYVLPAIGLMDANELVYPMIEAYAVNMGQGADSFLQYMKNVYGIYKVEPTNKQFTVKDVVGKEFYITLPYEKFTSNGQGGYSPNADYVSSRKVKIVGVIRQKETAASGALKGTLIYNKALTDSLLYSIKTAEIVTAQMENPEIDVFTGKAYENGASYHINLTTLGYVDKEKPASINIYSTTFEDKDYIDALIDNYNEDREDGEKIVYNDYLGTMMGGITDIIDAISYVLIGFVSVSLIVSSIMIGVITYISVLERTKEIGVLRALGASKRDVSRVFNAETVIIGFTSGFLGIMVTVLLNIPISLIIKALAGVPNVAQLPLLGGLILIVISMALTVIAGLIPSRIASKKDPVIALRTE